MAINLSNATPLSLNGGSQSQRLSYFGEKDTFSVELHAGTDYTFSTSLGSLYDSVLSLYDADGNLINFNDDGSGLASAITFTPSISGTYFLQVGAYGDSYTGSYEISAVGTEPENSAPLLTGTTTTFARAQANTTITITEAQLLAGWTDTDGDTLAVRNLNASSGTLQNNNDGTWSFRAPSSGTSTLTYEVTDGEASVTAQNSITTVAAPTPTISVTKVGNGYTTEDGGTTQISVALNVPITGDASFTVTLRASDTTEATFDGGASSQTLTFNASNWSTPQLVTLTGVQDYDNDGAAPYTVTATAAMGRVPASDYITAVRSLSTMLTLENRGDVDASGQDRDIPVYLVGDEGRPQQDHLSGNDGADRLYGGYMVDELNGGLGNDRLYGSYEDDVLFGGDGNDRLYGEQDDDYIDGGAGNDRMDGGIGADTLQGGAGDDTYYVTLGDDGQVEDTVDETADGSSGSDTIYIPFEVEAYVAPEGVEIIRMNAGFGDTALTGNSSSNGLYGNAGDNLLDGGTGNDTLSGGTGADSLEGGVGVDSLDGGIGSDNLDGGAGNDSLVGGAGDDDLTGGTGNDNVLAGAGNDAVAGDAGNDTITGDTGNDNLSGDDGNDNLSGGLNNDTVEGGAGNDTVAGDAGNDALIGDAGTDSLAGGAGNDVLTGGVGVDTLAGGAGTDTFDFNALTDTGVTATTSDVIADFTSGTDKVDLSGIDADTTVAGNQTFTQMLTGTTAFTRAAQVRWDTAADILYGNTDADADAEFMIRMTGVTNIVFSTDIIA